MEYQFRGKLWLWSGESAWHFVTVPEEISQEIREVYSSQSAGFGSIRVSVTIGSSTWTTSIFPDKKSGCYFLPIKKAIRETESLFLDSMFNITLKI